MERCTSCGKETNILYSINSSPMFSNECLECHNISLDDYDN
jgi:predicted nucleic acid-binding Zn ribbon protein